MKTLIKKKKKKTNMYAGGKFLQLKPSRAYPASNFEEATKRRMQVEIRISEAEHYYPLSILYYG